MLKLTESVFLPSALTHIALSQGYFQEAEVQVETRLTTSSTAQQADLKAGIVDVAWTATDNLFAWNARPADADTAADGPDIAVFAQVETTADMILTLRPGRTSVPDGAAVRLSVDAPTNGFAIAAYAMLEHIGLSRGEYEVVETGGVRPRFDALMAGRVDVTVLGPPLDEIGTAQGMSAVARITDIAPDYPGVGIVADRRRLEEMSDAVTAYLKALATGGTAITASAAIPATATPPPSPSPPTGPACTRCGSAAPTPHAGAAPDG